MFKRQNDNKDMGILKVKRYIEKNPKISKAELLGLAVKNLRTFRQRFKQAINNSVLQYI